MNDKQHQPEAPQAFSWTSPTMYFVYALLAAALLALVFGVAATKIAALVVVLTTLQGLWRGGTEIVGVVLGIVAALVTAPFVGKMLEGLVGGILGTTGLTNRLASIGVAGLLVFLVVAVAGGVAAKIWVKKRANLKKWDRAAGAALGAIEGTLLALAVIWVPMALVPVAQTQLVEAQRRRDLGEEVSQNPLAEGLVAFADGARSSVLGRTVGGVNPIGGADLFTLASDFAIVARDEEAYALFMESDAMRRLQEMQSMQAALDMVRADEELMARFEEDGVSTDLIAEVLRSDTILRVLDETSIAKDMAPLSKELADALRDARAKIEESQPALGAPRERDGAFFAPPS